VVCHALLSACLERDGLALRIIHRSTHFSTQSWPASIKVKVTCNRTWSPQWWSCKWVLFSSLANYWYNDWVMRQNVTSRTCRNPNNQQWSIISKPEPSAEPKPQNQKLDTDWICYPQP
jgi:hypothetical protein